MSGLGNRLRVVESSSAAARLDAAVAFLRQFSAIQPVTVVGATRGAADDLARRVARERGATIGLSRFSVTQFAARLGATALAGRGIAPTTALGAEAVAARAAFDAAAEGRLTYLAGVADKPGFPRALARTLDDLRLATIEAARVETAGHAGHDLARLLERADGEIEAAATADRTRLLATAAAAAASDPIVRAPLVLLDVPIDTAADEAFVLAIAAASSRCLATCPSHDEPALEAWTRAGLTVERIDGDRHDDLGNLRRFLFSDDAPADRTLDGTLQFFSAPGEGREAVEIARRILHEARRGVRFDEVAILVRSPQSYHGLLEHALERAGIPACFERGTRRPRPAGRAFLALIACACEGLSARRFAEYLSLGQLPSEGQERETWVPAGDEQLPLPDDPDRDDDREDARAWDVTDDRDGSRPAGTLRAPRQWERLLVEAAVIGGDPARWARRLEGLERQFTTRLEEATRRDGESGRIAGLTRDLEHLAHLRAFALPLVEELASWRGTAAWGVWLDRLEHLAPRVLRVPAYVMRVLADLRPMAAVGPVSLDEVRSVLSERLRLVDAEPPRRRYGRVFVGSPSQARGRAFRIVFVPGLAERMFPRKAVQDPLLTDEARSALDRRLLTRRDRARLERALLHVAVAAATERLYVSYPRLDVAEGRARVPSFYALDILRGATGRIPDHVRLAEAAAQAGDPSLAWPAPADPVMAIDDQEHDLAVLRQLLDRQDPAAVRGHAQYLLRLNPALRRSVTERWARGERKWSQFDGIIRVTDATRAALDAQRLGRRPYSLSALQLYAACPYKFLLSAIYRLHAADDPQPLQRLDPLTRGSIVHRIQRDLFRALRAAGLLPVTEATVERALLELERVIERVDEAYREELSPAIERVWHEEMRVIARDLRGWLRKLAAENGEWLPTYFELAFGLTLDEEHDPHSRPDEVLVDGRFKLRGSIDLVETHRQTGVLRVTDHKTGKDRTKDSLIVGGGETLQPVLYSLVVEQMLGRPVAETRLSFCTSAGGYRVRPVPFLPHARRAGIEVLEVVDRAIERGFLAPAPKEGACTWCDYRAVCGPAEPQRITRKPDDRLQDLLELRARP